MVKIYTRYFLICLLVFAFGTLAYAQQPQNKRDDSNVNKIGAGMDRGASCKSLVQAGKKARAQGDNYAALDYFKRAVEVDTSLLNVYREIAEIASELYLLPEARFSYQYLMDHDTSALAKKEARLGLAETYFKHDEYKDAQEYFSELSLDTVGFTQNQRILIDKRLGQLAWINSPASKSILNIQKVEILPDSNINSPYAEYSPVIHDNRLYFSSYRFPFPNDRHNPQRNLVKVMTAEIIGDSTLVKVQGFNENGRHTAHTAFSKDGSRMYYSECDFLDGSEIQCELFMREWDAQSNSWGKAQILPEPVNVKGFNNTEPNVGWNIDGDETLYFVSDRPGGSGGKDIWSAKVTNTGFGTPSNLSSINKSGDEVSPAYHSQSGTMFFSSDSYEGFGGFDIFASEYKSNNWTAPRNLGSALNTGANEVFFQITPGARMAFFSSNRNGRDNTTEVGCCYDIFRAELAKPSLIAVTFNAETGDSLSATKMSLFKVKGSNVELVQAKNVPDNHDAFELELNQAYRLIASKPYFKSDTIEIAPITFFEDTLRVVHLYLDPAVITLITNVYEKKKEKPSDVKFDIIPADSTTGVLTTFNMLGKQANLQINQKETTLTNSNQFIDRLDFDRVYTTNIFKKGYTSAWDTVSTNFYTEEDTVIVRDVYIERGLILTVRVYNKLDSTKLYGVTTTLFDTNNAQNRPKSQTNPNSYTYSYPVTFSSRYKVLGEKEGFFPDSTLEFATNRIRSFAFDTIYKDLYLACSDLACYLPIVLYFDNDQPRYDSIELALNKFAFKANPIRYKDTTSTINYLSLVNKYFNREDYFVKNHISGIPASQAAQGEQNVRNFFQADVRGSRTRLQLFADALEYNLEQGNDVEIVISGYASPLSNPEYNKYLTYRRIETVLNYFNNFNSPGYLKQLEARGGGRLTPIANPKGDSTAPKTVSQDPRNRSISVFSSEASKERRVEISSARAIPRQSATENTNSDSGGQ